MADRILTCRKCHKQFVAKDEEKGITWHERSRGYNYHMECWQEFINKNNDRNDEAWFDLIVDLITRELHEDYDYFKIKAQADGYVSKGGYSMKGIYFTLYWFFLIHKGEYKKEFGIAIVPHVYEQSSAYWLEQENKRSGIMDEIEKIKRIEAAEGRKIQVRKKKKKAPTAEPTFD